MREIYLDNAAATPTDAEVVKQMNRAVAYYANPSSYNDAGRAARTQLESARKKIARFLNAQVHEIIFTASGSEANSLAIQGLKLKKGEMITTAIEHKSVLTVASKFGAVCVGVDETGIVDVGSLREKIGKKTKLVSVMYANNEIGTIQPIRKIGIMIKELRKKNNSVYPYFQVDACQAAGYLPMDVNQLGVDLMSFNGTKIYGPRGTGVLYVRRTVPLKPLILGGTQEFGLRAGTENLPAIVGLTEAIKLIDKKEFARLAGLRDYFMEQLQKHFPETKINGARGDRRLCNNISISFPNADVERLLLELDKRGIRAGSGSACTAHDVEPSHVLRAIGNEKKYLHALRFSLGRQTTKKDIGYALKSLVRILSNVNKNGN